jgi:hypothetical protein
MSRRILSFPTLFIDKLSDFIKFKVGFADPKEDLINSKFCCNLKIAGAILVIAAKNRVSVATELSALLIKN